MRHGLPGDRRAHLVGDRNRSRHEVDLAGRREQATRSRLKRVEGQIHGLEQSIAGSDYGAERNEAEMAVEAAQPCCSRDDGEIVAQCSDMQEQKPAETGEDEAGSVAPLDSK